MVNSLSDKVFKIVDIKNGFFSNQVTLEVLEDFNWETTQSLFTFDFDKGEYITIKARHKNILEWPVGTVVNWFHALKYSTSWANYSGVEKMIG